jgi:RNA polymerase sigma-70 factor (ECF subfamily)
MGIPAAIHFSSPCREALSMAQAFVSQFEPTPIPRAAEQSFEPRSRETPAPESAVVRARSVGPQATTGLDVPSVHARLAPVVRRLVFALLGPDQEREDVMQEIFIRIFLGLSRLRDPERLEQWTARVAINTVKNELRRRKRRRLSTWDPLLEPDRLVWHSDFDGRNVALHAVRAIELLPERERALLLRRWFQPTTTDSLASDSACSARTIKRRLRRAQSRFARLVQRDASLNDWLEAHGATEDDPDDDR